jgi:hypothetical protein
MTPKCIWTNRKSDRVIAIEIESSEQSSESKSSDTVYVLPEHEDDVRRFFSFASGKRLLFLIGILAIPLVLGSVVMGLALAGFSNSVVLGFGGAALVLFGFFLIALPIPTPETIKLMGIYKSVLSIRFVGGLIVLWGFLTLLPGQ